VPRILADDEDYVVVPSGLGGDPRRPSSQWWESNVLYDDLPGLFDLSTAAREGPTRRGKGQGQVGEPPIVGGITSEPRQVGPVLTEAPAGANDQWYDYAKQQIGIDYVFGSWNAAGQEDGGGEAFDCSGFTGAVLEAGGYKSIPHSAAQQSTMFPFLKKNQLKPGDLVFYNYGRLGPNTVDHVAIYIGNGRQIAASSSADKVTIQQVDWSHFVHGGDTKLSSGGAFDAGARARARGPQPGQLKTAPAYADVTLVPGSMGSNPSLATVTANVMSDMFVDSARTDKRTPSFKNTKGMSGAIKQQLYRGFMDAGKPELAKMVGTKEFDTWISAESGWDPNNVSKYYAGHGRNAGLFQFALLNRSWVWDDVDRSSWVYNATPYEQAKMVTKYFNLTPGDIRRYASEINSGSYQGWG
jgi:cell wall-associated NlpC family hydrolase